MSIESAKSFIERINTDSEFAKRAMEQRGKEQIAAFLQEAGYEFSEAEYREAVNSINGNELSDDRLDRISGGSSCVAPCASWGVCCG